jgi:hypothetical protein
MKQQRLVASLQSLTPQQQQQQRWRCWQDKIQQQMVCQEMQQMLKHV